MKKKTLKVEPREGEPKNALRVFVCGKQIPSALPNLLQRLRLCVETCEQASFPAPPVTDTFLPTLRVMRL